MANMAVSFRYFARKLEELEQNKQVTFDEFHHGDNYKEIARNFYECAKSLKVDMVTIQENGLNTIIYIS